MNPPAAAAVAVVQTNNGASLVIGLANPLVVAAVAWKNNETSLVRRKDAVKVYRSMNSIDPAPAPAAN